MGKFEDILTELRGDGLDHFADELEPFGATELRKKASRADQAERERDAALAKVDELEVLPKKHDALRNFGVDFDALRPGDLAEIRRATADTFDELWAEKFAEEYQLPIGAGGTSGGIETTNAADVVRQARSAPVGGAARSGVIDEATIAGWSPSQRMEFRKKHPQEWAAIGDGHEITGISFP